MKTLRYYWEGFMGFIVRVVISSFLFGLALALLTSYLHWQLEKRLVLGGQMDRELKKVMQWLGIAALIIVLANMLGGCMRIEAQPKPEPQPSVVITSVAQNHLDFFYFAIAERGKLEASFCMVGFHDKKTGAILVQSLLPIWVDSASNGSLFHRPSDCQKEAGVIGVLHFHPPRFSCDMSDVDVIAAHWNAYDLTGIVCKPGSLPKLEITRRKEFELAFEQLHPDTTKAVAVSSTGLYEIVYRFHRPP